MLQTAAYVNLSTPPCQRWEVEARSWRWCRCSVFFVAVEEEAEEEERRRRGRIQSPAVGGLVH